MAKRVELQIDDPRSPGTPFTFDVEGVWQPRFVPVYREGSNPLEIETLTETWEFRGCRIVSSSGADSELWTQLLDFLALFKDPANHPAFVRLVRDPGGANQELLRLGPTTPPTPGTSSRLRFVELVGDQDPQLEAASWSKTATIDLTVAADNEFPDADDIVNFSQTVEHTYEDGCDVVTMRTQITTSPGEDAREKAKTFGTLNAANFGDNYSYLTNGPDGIEFTVLDADERGPTARIPNVVESVSQIRAWGITVGPVSPGSSPDTFSLRIVTRITADETITTTIAEARGPNSVAWVRAQKPSGTFTDDVVEEEKAGKSAIGTWVKATQRSGAQERTRQISVRLWGGARVEKFTPVTNGFAPVLQQGAFLPWRCEIDVTVSRRGGAGTPADLKLPGLLKAPWRLDREASREGQPVLTEPAISNGSNKWSRTASLVYRSATKPKKNPAEEVRVAPSVESYWL